MTTPSDTIVEGIKGALPDVRVEVDAPDPGNESGTTYINVTNGTVGLVLEWWPKDQRMGLSVLPCDGYGLYAPDEILDSVDALIARAVDLLGKGETPR